MTPPSANGSYHHERVYIQAHSGDQVLVQYVTRKPAQVVFWEETPSGHSARTRPVSPWAWLPAATVQSDEELDAALARIWGMA